MARIYLGILLLVVIKLVQVTCFALPEEPNKSAQPAATSGARSLGAMALTSIEDEPIRALDPDEPIIEPSPEPELKTEDKTNSRSLDYGSYSIETVSLLDRVLNSLFRVPVAKIHHQRFFSNGDLSASLEGGKRIVFKINDGYPAIMRCSSSPKDWIDVEYNPMEQIAYSSDPFNKYPTEYKPADYSNKHKSEKSLKMANLKLILDITELLARFFSHDDSKIGSPQYAEYLNKLYLSIFDVSSKF